MDDAYAESVAEAHAAEEEEELVGGDEGAEEDDGAVDTWSDDESAADAPKPAAATAAASKQVHKPELDCPYCAARHQTEADFEAHLASCSAIED